MRRRLGHTKDRRLLFHRPDSAGIEKAGISPLQEQLNVIDEAKDARDILNAAALLTTTGTRNIIGSRVGQDDKNSSKMMVQLGQSGLGLPNRDYYFKTDARTTRIRLDYTHKHLPAMLAYQAGRGTGRGRGQRCLQY